MFQVKNTKLITLTISVISVLCSSQFINAQQKVFVSKPSDTAWIQMMENPNVNYLKAVENFETFWKNKRKPKEESEVFEEVESLNEDKKVEKFTNPNEPAVKYFFEYKKFKQWQQDVLPYLQPNGSILNMEERIVIWKQQQEIIKKQQSKETSN
jgi:hypothetical protein